MSTNDQGPISKLLIGSAVSIVFGGLLIIQQCSPLGLGGMCRIWMLLPPVLG